MKGVVAGVRDYGNRMGIPTVNGAIFFDDRYLGNPLVFCGNVGLIPRDRTKKRAQAGDLIVSVGGRTGRDGIHGATFSSIELTHQSDVLSGGAVQIGNAITQKMVLDVILQARDAGLYHAITDCGAGGFSSAVGEMGAEIGAEVWLDRVPLKYQGLSYTEIWISEAQERMVLAVPESNWPQFESMCKREGVEATVIGRFQPTGRLRLKYQDQVVADLEMHFLHEGRPPVMRKAVWARPADVRRPGLKAEPPRQQTPVTSQTRSVEPAFNPLLHRVLSSWNVCSKEWVIRQYDHEVQGGSVIKPLVGANNDGPSDAAVIRPVLSSNRGLAIACGMNPLYGQVDPYWMAASAIDEAIRNCVAVGADPDRIAILDNFCWGNTDRPEELGKLVRAALACRDVATAYGTPFISGKDSLNNEFKVPPDWRDRLAAGSGTNDRIVIPSTLLISALGQIDDIRRCVTMDLKEPGNALFLVGRSSSELAGSHWELATGLDGGHNVPQVDPVMGRAVMRFVHGAISQGYVRSCHDLSEGGLAVALAEMAFAGMLGVSASILEPYRAAQNAHEGTVVPDGECAWLLFSESNSRFVIEVPRQRLPDFVRYAKSSMTESQGVAVPPCVYLGVVTNEPTLRIIRGPAPKVAEQKTTESDQPLVLESISALKESWHSPLRW
jgi:phosphoribosylformylglycinamidine synthase